MQNLFDYEVAGTAENDRVQNVNNQTRNSIEYQDVIKNKLVSDSVQSDNIATSDVVRIVWFYENNSFEEFFPKK